MTRTWLELEVRTRVRGSGRARVKDRVRVRVRVRVGSGLGLGLGFRVRVSDLVDAREEPRALVEDVLDRGALLVDQTGELGDAARPVAQEFGLGAYTDTATSTLPHPTALAWVESD